MKFVRSSFVAALLALSALVGASADAACPFSIAGLTNAGNAVMLADGLLFFRGAGVAQGTAITANSGTAVTADAVLNSIAANEAALDMNANGRFDLDDAAIVVRYLAGFRGTSLAATIGRSNRKVCQ
jgi:hypothetical protein